MSPLAKSINNLLPQTQCTKCGYAGCAPYAQAIANNEADYNRCPPGGAEGIKRLAHFLKKKIKPLNTDCGVEKYRTVAFIDEEKCIGCTLCIQACPVDAIMGTAKQMHTVINQWCTGCDLCVTPCPVDCITMRPVSNELNVTGWQAWSEVQADTSRKRHEQKIKRMERNEHSKRSATITSSGVLNLNNSPVISLSKAKKNLDNVSTNLPSHTHMHTHTQSPQKTIVDHKKELLNLAIERARQRREKNKG